MFLWLLLALPLPAVAALDKTHGVSPALQAKYTPSASGTWFCLDGSKEIPWKAVNDDYCDCPDGSDEPGTSACPGTTFYCKNVGHIGATIPSSRVQDGLCELECCDGSDEAPGVCSNICEEVGKEYRKRVEAERKLRKTGSKIRATYIAFAQKEKNRIEKLTVDLEREVASRELEVERLRDIAKRAESISAAELERKKQSPLYQSLLTHQMALTSLRNEHNKHLETEKALGAILDSLRTGYNPNYQDMAVLEAVRGWEYLAGLPHINDIRKGEDSAEETQTQAPKVEEEGVWNADQIERELDRLLKTDHISLLLEHEKIVGHPATKSTLFEVTAYLPDSLVPHYVSLRDTVHSWLRVFGIESDASDTSDEANQARQALSDAEHSLKLTREEEETAYHDLSALFDPDGFGPEGEWKRLDGLCLEMDTGDYTYEVCLFDEARQKPNKGGSTVSLGKFSSWNKLAEPGELEYYTKQRYTQGTKCWNGPHRSLGLILSCGTENALLTVAELEKCEYQITGTSPALCRPLEDENRKDEL
ncbi:glucosidase II beta subunit-like-domain-containing protein [Boletus edulis BED1]|uniref:Glucosidase 2 subunit beta n=1 Tax=Boletus edulis BED1 TaxID=1328754 RepID=A0AAD4GME1_BOLED|nr:glucosidase II beta subunit-like-domain-containing protein [Boletus edulis BED1]